METLETGAKTVDEAVNLALKQLGASRADVDVVVLSEGRSGIFGIGAEDARVRVTRLEEPAGMPVLLGGDAVSEGDSAEGRAPMASLGREPEHVARVRMLLIGLLESMQVDAEVITVEPPAFGVPPNVDPVAFDIEGDDLGLLIGRRGQTLASLQYLVNLMASRLLPENGYVVLDVEGYRRRRYDALQTLAQRMAERVRATGQSLVLEPMPAAERRIIHVTLEEHPDVTTQSFGEGENRKVEIILRRR